MAAAQRQDTRPTASGFRESAEKGPARFVESPGTDGIAVQELRREVARRGIRLAIQAEQQRLAQEELQKSRDRYYDLYDNAPVGYLTLSADGRIREANATVCNLLGVKKSSLPGQRFSDFVHDTEVNQSELYLHRRAAYESSRRFSSEIMLKGPDGAPFHAQLESHAVWDEARHSQELRLVITDISARMIVEEDTRLLAAAVEHSSEAILIMDHRGVVRYANPAYTRLTGYARHEVLGTVQQRFEIKNGNDADCLAVREAIAETGFWQGRTIQRRKDGTTYPCAENITLLCDESGKPANYVSIQFDMSEQTAPNATGAWPER
jgi:PAS domain S-box-containing protein